MHIVQKIFHHPRSIIFILLIVFILYLPTLSHDLVWDDGYFLDWPGFQNITAKIPSYLQGKSPMSAGLVYRPLRSVYYALSLDLWGKNYVLFHLQAILLHLMVVFLIYKNSKLLLHSQSLALISATIFAVHPLLTESVTWITASFDTIGSLWFFVSFYCYQLYRHSKRHKFKKWSVIFAGLAFFSYELTFCLLPILIAYDYLLIQKRFSFPQFVRVYLPYLLLIGLYFFIKASINLQASSPISYIFPLYLSLTLFPLVLLGKYLLLFLWPFSPSINHQILTSIDNLFFFQPHPVAISELFSPNYVLLPLLIVVALAFGIWKSYHRHQHTLTFLLLWIPLTLLPVLQLIPLTSVFAEKYMYLAMFGLANLCVLVINYIYRRSPIFASIFTCLLIVVLCLSTWNRNQVWTSPLSFWQTAQKSSPQNAYILRQLAATQYMLQNYTEAIRIYENSLLYDPTNTRALINLGYLYSQAKNYSQARHMYNQVLELEPQNQEAKALLSTLPPEK